MYCGHFVVADALDWAVQGGHLLKDHVGGEIAAEEVDVHEHAADVHMKGLLLVNFKILDCASLKTVLDAQLLGRLLVACV